MKFKLILLTAIATFGLTAATIAQVPNYVPSNGLVGWWPFNGNANDESGNGNNGTVNGATLTSDRFGNAGKAYSFVSSYINVPNSNSLQINNQLSISLWVNFNSFPNVSCILSTGSDEPSSADSWVCWFFPSSGNQGSGGINIFQQTSTQPYCGNGCSNLNTNQWINFLYDFDGNTANAYMNGI